ncbi:MAG: glutamine-hydrolyzing carbamoyl-phosphate synthase small subunit, partial [bacterium]
MKRRKRSGVRGQGSEGVLFLEDGRVFYGKSCGAFGEKTGEIVFNTSMTGYQEILTDPSYCGQIVNMTYPLIGNYGVNNEDVESSKPQVEGFVVKEMSKRFSNFRAKKSLSNYLKKNNIIAIEGIDTRALTRHIRDKGAMKAIISTIDLNIESLQKKLSDAPGIIGKDLVQMVTCKEKYTIPCKNKKAKIAVFDFGVKLNILRKLTNLNCELIIFPAFCTADEILKEDPDGILLSNGPGDPEGVPYVIDEVKRLIKTKIPIFGICLGHQILCLAFSGKTYKLKFGHRGGNQPVLELKTGKIDITSQNHGFCVDIKSLPEIIEKTYINPNDNTLEGMEHKELPIFSVQYHPEASPGPHDSSYLFDRFVG